LKAIKRYCLSCRGNELAVLKCRLYSCWLWSFRTSSRPDALIGLTREQYVSLFNFHVDYKAGTISEDQYVNTINAFFKEKDIFNEIDFYKKRKALIRRRAKMLCLPDPVYPNSNLYADQVTENNNQIIFHDVLPVNYDVEASGKGPVSHLSMKNHPNIRRKQERGFEPSK